MTFRKKRRERVRIQDNRKNNNLLHGTMSVDKNNKQRYELTVIYARSQSNYINGLVIGNRMD